MRSDAGLALLAGSACLLVARPTAPALTDAIRTWELARAIGTPLAQIVQNRGDETTDTDRIADALGAPVSVVPESNELARAYRAGQPIGRVAPDDPAARALGRTASTLERTLGA